MKEKYLPVGTVVLLKDATKKLMITGYCSMLPSDQTKVYDYVGVLFPEANMAGEDVALFNHEQINVISHMGLEDEEYKNFNVNLIKVINEELPSVKKENDSIIPAGINEVLQNVTPDVIQEQMLGPTDFDVKIPSFDINSSKEKEEATETNSESVLSNVANDDKVDITKDTGDGSPVLQLEPIMVEQNVNNDNSDNGSSTGFKGIFELERL